MPISWEEGAGAVAARGSTIFAHVGVLDRSGPAVCALTLGHGGTPANYMGTFPAFIAACPSISDLDPGGVKYVHSEHLYGSTGTRLSPCPPTSNCQLQRVAGANVEVTGGVLRRSAPCPGAGTRHQARAD